MEKLTIEQAIGQILLLIREMEERLQELEGRVLSAPDPRELVER